jgi:rare lipoprotein A (peptidoglycan hydrolase)
LVATAALTAAVALVALPGLAGSRSSSPEPILDPAAFQTVLVNAKSSGPAQAVDPLDPANRSAGAVDDDSAFQEPGEEFSAPSRRPKVDQPGSALGVSIKKPRYTLSGIATFYDNGTTAMKLPRGTVIRVCGAGGCIERVVNDYGPFGEGRIVDLYRPDFFRVCGCGSWSGTTQVTVSIY